MVERAFPSFSKSQKKTVFPISNLWSGAEQGKMYARLDIGNARTKKAQAVWKYKSVMECFTLGSTVYYYFFMDFFLLCNPWNVKTLKFELSDDVKRNSMRMIVETYTKCNIRNIVTAAS